MSDNNELHGHPDAVDYDPGQFGGHAPDESPEYAEGDHGTPAKQGATETGGGKPGMNDMTPREHELKETDRIPKDLKTVKRVLEEKAGLGASFDLVLREMDICGHPVGLFYANGFAKDQVLTEVLMTLTALTPQQIAHDTLETLMKRYIPHIQVECSDSMNAAVAKVLAGSTALFADGEAFAVLVDAKNFPVRSIDEPDLERVVRGSRDGFVETMLTNVSLVRRRIRDPRLKLELQQVGRRTKTDVCIGYIQDIADYRLVEAIRSKVKKVNTDGIPLADKQLEEALIGKGWNPYPMVRYSERPDVVSAHLLEGHVCVFVDTSPSVMIMPTTIFHLVQHAEEYRQAPFMGTYIRWIRYAGIWASVFLLPLWYLMVSHPGLKPPGLEWIGPEKNSHLPIILQFILAEIGIDLMRMAAIHTPTPLATAMGLVAAILVGDIAVKTGLFVNEVILYLAVASIGMFATPSYELSMANRIARLVLLIATAIFAVPGFVVASTLFVIFLAMQRSFHSPFLWPFIPFDFRALTSIVIRRPFLARGRRLSLTKPLDDTRQPS